MGWFCNEIIFQYSKQLLEYLKADSYLSESLYYVKDITSEYHNFPDEGLIFIRGIGNLEQGIPGVFLDWEKVSFKNDVVIEIAANIPQGIYVGEQFSPNPPTTFLKYLKWVSKTYNVATAYYETFSWGGPLECEYAWGFAPDDFVYTQVLNAYWDNGRVRTYLSEREYSEEEGEVLSKALTHFGIQTNRYFEPHAGFDWELYQVK